jgi:hypothetical protein
MEIAKGVEMHLVSFDVPFPASYGGVVDVFYKLKALHELGCKIHLHCFEYGRARSPELEKYCASVHYYRRDENKLNFLKKDPYVVVSRANNELLSRIQQDNLPVFIEGLHNCWLLNFLKPSDRLVMVRTHNVEHDYYNGLAKVEKNIAKRQYYKWEAGKLQKFEEILHKADMLFTISPNDCNYFQSLYGHAVLLPAFHSSTEITCAEGKGSYALYHGNLAVGENSEAASYLVNEVFSKIEYPLIIAGSNPTPELVKVCKERANIKLLADVSVEQLDKLIAEAHINVLPTFQPTGIKLKLLSALHKGRFCVVNNEMVENTGLEKICLRADLPEAMCQLIISLADKDFTIDELSNRALVLKKMFSNTANATIILHYLEKVVL